MIKWENFVLMKNIAFLSIAMLILIFIYAFFLTPFVFLINESLPSWIVFTFIYALIMLADSIIFQYARINDIRYQKTAVKLLMGYLLIISLLLSNAYIVNIATPIYRYTLFPKIIGATLLIISLTVYFVMLKERDFTKLTDITVKASIAILITIIINGTLLKSTIIDTILSVAIIIVAFLNIIIAAGNYMKRTPLYTSTVLIINASLIMAKTVEIGYKVAYELFKNAHPPT